MIHNSAVLRLFRKSAVSSFRRSFSIDLSGSWKFDCTGRAVMCSSDENLDRVNHIVSNIVTGNEKYSQYYEDLLASGEGGVLTLSLALIDKNRSGLRDVKASRRELRQRLIEMDIGKKYFRERYFAATALQWDEGNHLIAAGLLETLISKVGTDTLATKLAQEAYILAGHSESALGCLIRHPATFNAMDQFNTTVVGLTSVGYLENSKLPEAEESAKRAVAMSGGKDLISLLALLDCYHLTGKSSDMLEVLDNYEPLHARDLGKYFLLCRRGNAQVMRGNCNGGFKTLAQLFETQSANKYDKPLQLEEFPLQILTESGLVLWQIIMNLDGRHVIALDQVTVPFSKAIDNLPDDEPLKMLLKSIVLSATLHSLESKNASEYIFARKTEIQRSTKAEKAQKSSTWNPLSFFRAEDTPSSDGSTKDNSEIKVEQPIFSEEVLHDNENRINAIKEQIEHLVSSLKKLDFATTISNGSSTKHHLSDLLPELNFLFESTSSTTTKRVNALRSISIAIGLFALKDYSGVVQELSHLHRNGYKSAGLSASQRDAVWQTFIEGYVLYL